MGKKNGYDSKNSKEDRLKFWGAFLGLLTATVVLVGTLFKVIPDFIPKTLPTPSPLNYIVNVQDKNTGAPIVLAQVIVDVIGEAPLTGVTDNLGNASFLIDAKKTGQPIRLTVRKDGYKDYVANANAVSGLPVQVLLDRNEITNNPPSIIPTSTQVFTAVPPLTLSLIDNCINNTWTPYKGDQMLKSSKGCWQLDKWGISSQNNGLRILMQNTESDNFLRGIYNNSLPLQNVSIDLGIKINKLSILYDRDSDIGFGIIFGNPPDPKNGVFLIYQIQASQNPDVFIKVLANGNLDIPLRTTYKYGDNQRVTLQIDGIALNIYLDGEKIYGPVGLGSAERSFWIGYNLTSGGNLDAEITQLKIQSK